MKKGQIYEGVIERVLFPNKGQVRIEEKTVTVKNGVPGQKVRFQVNKIRKGKAEGRLLEVLECAPGEQEPACRHFGDCGGCIWQTLSYEDQLCLKEQQVRELLDQAVRGGSVSFLFEGIKGSPVPYGYRNKMEFSFGDEVKDGPLALGMHKKGSFYDIVTVDGCQIADEDFGLILKETLDFFREKKIPFYHKMQHKGYLRHLLVRKGTKTGEILAGLVTTGQAPFGEMNGELFGQNVQEEAAGTSCGQEQCLLEEWVGRLRTLPLKGTLTGILHIRNDSLADVVQSDGTEVLFGRDHFYEELLGLKFRISPFSFFQTNSLGAEVLYETAREYIGDTKGRTIYDLYSGTGTIAQIPAPVAEKVIGVEIVEEAVEAARENAAQNGLSNCEFIAGDVLKVLDTVEERPDLIVLDPPRDGIHPKALKKIIDYGVDRMVYISCKPTSLARDLEMLQEHGYRAERACCVDMFPWSGNVETVCLLSNTQRPKKESYITLDVEMKDYYRIKNEGKNSNTGK